MSVPKTGLLAVALVLSLAGNAVLGSMVLNKPAAPPPKPFFPGSLWPIIYYMKSAPPDQQKLLEEIVGPARDSLQMKFEELTDERDRIARMLRAEPLDRRQLEQEFAKYRSMTQEIQETQQTAILDAATAVPQQADRERMLTRPPRGAAQKAAK